jgi:parvulin-like peptidyl-prolyl isomerase
MKENFLKRMMVAAVIGLVSLLGTSELSSAQQRGRERGRQPQQEQRQVQQQQRASQQQERLAQQQQRLEQQRQQQALQQQRLILQRQQEQQRLVLQRQQQQLALQRQQQQLALQRQQEQLRLERLRQEQIRLQNERNRSRSVYTTPNNRGYRVYRNGGYYQTDQNGINVLQQAVNYGYQQGVSAGRSDRASGRGFNYQNPAAYRSANYGYSYVDSSQYQYYFREGFRRGYEDGYNSRFQYGSNSNGKLNILAAILQQVLNFQAF